MKKVNVYEEFGESGTAYMNFIKTLAKESALDEKVHHLSYLSVLTAKNMTGGLDFHVKELIKLGATREEIKSSILVAMPVIGMQVTPILEEALSVFDNNKENK